MTSCSEVLDLFSGDGVFLDGLLDVDQDLPFELGQLGPGLVDIQQRALDRPLVAIVDRQRRRDPQSPRTWRFSVRKGVLSW